MFHCSRCLNFKTTTMLELVDLYFAFGCHTVNTIYKIKCAVLIQLISSLVRSQFYWPFHPCWPLFGTALVAVVLRLVPDMMLGIPFSIPLSDLRLFSNVIFSYKSPCGISPEKLFWWTRIRPVYKGKWVTTCHA